MKKIILPLLLIMLCFPALMFSGCSKKSNLPKVNSLAYFESNPTATIFNATSTKSISFEDICASSPNIETLDKFVQINITAKNDMIYKMYIDCIYFYVYTNSSTPEEMIINFKMTNLADENDMRNPITFSQQCSLLPKDNGSTLCKINIGKVVPTGTGSLITIDILNSVSGTVSDASGNETSFKWLIYGFEMYGESRSYSK